MSEFRVIKSNAPLPSGWSYMEYNEALSYHNEFKHLLPEWGIVKCGSGSFDGSGYGYNHRANETR